MSLAYRQSEIGGRPDVNQPAAKPRLGPPGGPESLIGATTALTDVLSGRFILHDLTDFDASCSASLIGNLLPRYMVSHILHCMLASPSEMAVRGERGMAPQQQC